MRSWGFASPLSLAVRLQRGTVTGWCVGLAAFGFFYGVIIDSIEDFVSDTEAMADFIAAGGGASLTDSYLGQSTWALVAVALVIGMFGPILDLPSWVSNLSPFEHVGLVPAESTAVAPLVVLLVVAAALAVVGSIGITRRDLPS